MEDPLKYLTEKYGIDVLSIKQIVFGKKYIAVMLNNGNIGVCATLLNKININIEDLNKHDINNFQHRIIINAYFNAVLNYTNDYKNNIDIFDAVNFKSYKNLVMIGYFKPLIRKFNIENIKFSIFDKSTNNGDEISMEKQMEYVAEADAIVLTGTSIFNGTFMNIIKNTSKHCNIFLLGPSAIMSKDIFEYKNVKMIFGSVFEKNDHRVIDIIKEGFGTRHFLRFGKKVYLQKEN